MNEKISEVLHRGVVIPAHPLALDADRQLDERGQRALARYYLAAGAGGLAVGVHTTQFAIHDPSVGWYERVLKIAAEEMDQAGSDETVRVAGIIGDTKQAAGEAALAGELGYHSGLLGLSAMRGASEDELIEHCRAVADVIPVFGFYLQPGIGGIDLPYSFWRRFVEIDNVIAIKIAAFDRYNTLDVIRALSDAGRDDIALYTGNDDHIVGDLISCYRLIGDDGVMRHRRFAGGLLGHWAVWTKSAVDLLSQCKDSKQDASLLPELLIRNGEVTDCNAVLFDAANGFVGCIPGIMEVLRRQGLVQTNLCIDPNECLSLGQADQIDRICAAYPHLTDDEFVKAGRAEWLA
ncbi:dihydrodipicolinate synthase family protein [Planctomycetes bacterium K23_9]|uniref:Dihydrodipicolinate synthetase family protein n=1 Tax=Stieleria marina TaxID=1930275 RepID=A0A517NP16_9BACT|nr:Dihydrodipicolinate synthetase family protein [Planctomycetes bacterium K23_9]